MIVTKYYCDICEKEIQRDCVGERFKPWLYAGSANWSAEVMIAKNNVWNDGMICMDCLRKILASKQEFATDNFREKDQQP